MTDVFATYLLRNQNQRTLELLQEAFPDNDHIQENVGQMVSKKKLWKEKLKLQWSNRRRPLYTQWDVRNQLPVQAGPGAMGEPPDCSKHVPGDRGQREGVGDQQQTLQRVGPLSWRIHAVVFRI